MSILTPFAPNSRKLLCKLVKFHDSLVTSYSNLSSRLVPSPCLPEVDFELQTSTGGTVSVWGGSVPPWAQAIQHQFSPQCTFTGHGLWPEVGTPGPQRPAPSSQYLPKSHFGTWEEKS